MIQSLLPNAHILLGSAVEHDYVSMVFALFGMYWYIPAGADGDHEIWQPVHCDYFGNERIVNTRWSCVRIGWCKSG